MNYKMYKNCIIFATHGDCQQERELGQRFVLDIYLLGRDLNKVCNAISDEAVEKAVNEVAVDTHYDLVQAVVYNLSNRILSECTEDVLEVKIELRKPCSTLRVGPPGGLIKHIGSHGSARREGYKTEYTNMEDYRYTRVDAARIFNKDVKFEVDVDVAFPMEDSIREDNVAFSFSYTTIYDTAVDTTLANKDKSPEDILQEIVNNIYKINPKVYKVRATIRNLLPENNMSIDCMEYQLVK